MSVANTNTDSFALLDTIVVAKSDDSLVAIQV